MDEIAASNELLLDELFHLENYVSLANYDPWGVFQRRKTAKFTRFKEANMMNVELPATKTPDDTPRRHSRRAAVSATPSAADAQFETKLDQDIRNLLLQNANRHNKQANGSNGSNGSHKKAPALQTKAKQPVFEQNSKKRGRPMAKQKQSKQKVSNLPVTVVDDPESESEEEELIPFVPLKRVKKLTLHVTVKPPVIEHPSHISKSEFKNMEELFQSYNNILEDPAPEIPSEEFPEYINSQHELVKRIKAGLDDELLILDPKENVFRNVPPNVREPTMIKKNPNYTIAKFKPPQEPFRLKNEFTHNDHLIAQSIRSSKLIKDMRNQRIQRCRKVAQMIEAHFKKQSMETERQEKDFAKRRLRLARDTAKEVRKKWLVALKAYKILEEREREEERAVKSKEQLSKILDHSTKVLGNQMKAKTSSLEPTSGDDENDQEDFDDVEEDVVDSDVNLSSSDEEEQPDELDVVDDSKLTVEQLKEKYGDKLKDVALKPVSIVDQLTEEQRQKLNEDNSENPILNESDSSAMSDDSMSGSDSSSSSDGEPAQGSNLHSLFGTSKTNVESEDDDDSVYSEIPEDQTTPSSSPEHQADGDVNEDEGIPEVAIPSLLRGTLRPYQKQGLDWLASLYNNGTNGILADEMGLGKTIQTISLLSYIACEHNDWGPHLIVVPTSVMLNWEMEFKRFAPGFKVLTYYGSPQQRKEKRKGWNTPDTFHVCITSYQLVVHDQPIFRRKKWKYLILDEAHNIKNFRSQRWKSLLNFNTEHRLLLTGTPLQNNIIELWSLLYFLMPSSTNGSTMPEGFADLMDFQQWFGRPVDKIIQAGGDVVSGDQETKETVNKLHQVLRPYLLRRLKQDVEKEMPGKYEHIVYCRLSKRQRLLYDDFMSRAQTRETLASGNFLSIINCLMQLRKVCNHPDLFEVRPILTSFAQQKSVTSDFKIKEIITRKSIKGSGSQWDKSVDLNFVNLLPNKNNHLNTYHMDTMKEKSMSSFFKGQEDQLISELKGKDIEPNYNNLEKYYEFILNKEKKDLLDEIHHLRYYNDLNVNKQPIIPADTVRAFTILNVDKERDYQLKELQLIKPIESRAIQMSSVIEKYSFVTPNVVCKDMPDLVFPNETFQNEIIHDSQMNKIENPFHQSQMKTSIAFPDKSLLQYDCGKLQKLSALLHEIIPQGHRVLIFTQMSKVLDILEQFLNYNGYTYMRLDGSTKIEDRQLLTERFNNDSRVKCFILSSRAGGIGINLTGADTVVFYDSDWNPAMDKQCQDRCHRIGQTRDVHIYRFVSEYTIESNILKKAEQKRQLDNVVIQEGGFTTDYFSRLTVHDMLGDEVQKARDDANDVENTQMGSSDFSKALEQAEDVEDSNAAKLAMTEVNVDTEDFTEETEQPVKEGDEGAAMALKVKRREPLEPGEFSEDDDDDDEVGHVDEYMIRFIAGGFSDLL